MSADDVGGCPPLRVCGRRPKAGLRLLEGKFKLELLGEDDAPSVVRDAGTKDFLPVLRITVLSSKDATYRS